MSEDKDRQRALRGSIGAQYPLKLSKELDRAARAAAAREGISLAEWWRRAGEAWLAQWPEYEAVKAPISVLIETRRRAKGKAKR